MRIDGGASPTLISVSYSGYSADTGGALCVLEGSAPTIANALITGSSASYGAALYSAAASPRLVNATITGNGGPGAALYLAGGSPSVESSIIWNNAGGSVTEGALYDVLVSVTDSETGDPLSGVTVDVDEGAQDIAAATTNGAGQADIQDLSADQGVVAGDVLTYTLAKDGYEPTSIDDVVDAEEETLSATLTPTSAGQDYTLTVNTYEIGAQAFPGADAPGVLETATLTVGDQTYALDLSGGTETITVTIPGDVQSFTLDQDDPDYIDTSVLNFTPKTYSEQPDKQGTTITINKDEISTNQTLRYELIPSRAQTDTKPNRTSHSTSTITGVLDGKQITPSSSA